MKSQKLGFLPRNTHFLFFKPFLVHNTNKVIYLINHLVIVEHEILKLITSFRIFNSYKLSANSSNTTYTVGDNVEVIAGAPDILWQSIVYIKDKRKMWTHGILYDYIEDAPVDDKEYVRKNGEWAEVLDASTGNHGYMTSGMVEELIKVSDSRIDRKTMTDVEYDDSAVDIIVEGMKEKEYQTLTEKGVDMTLVAI